MANDIVIVGGLVPSLLFSNNEPDPLLGTHVGTRDIDVALSLLVLDEERYKTIRKLLLENGFTNDPQTKGTSFGNAGFVRTAASRWISLCPLIRLMVLEPANLSILRKTSPLSRCWD